MTPLRAERAAVRRLILRLPLAPPSSSAQVPDPSEGMDPAAFVRAAIARAGGVERAKQLSKRKRRQIAAVAARARWEPAAGKRGKRKRKRVVVEHDDFTWQAMPPISELEARARDICCKLLHGGHRSDFDRMLAQRPDWQAHVDYLVVTLMQTYSG